MGQGHIGNIEGADLASNRQEQVALGLTLDQSDS